MRVKVILRRKNEAGILYNRGGLASVDRLAQRAWANVEELNFKGENPKLDRAGSEPRPLRRRTAKAPEI